jgi:Zn-dependent protease
MDIGSILVSVFVVLFAITVHEASHAWMANKLGDPTAASLGRASLNPLVHIDLFGTIILPAILIYYSVTHGGGPVFGWAKPVPYNPRNLRDPRRGGLWISLAGPGANVLTAVVAAMLFRVLRLALAGLPMSSGLIKPIGTISAILIAMVSINLTLAVFNLIPVPPLDGSGILAGLLTERGAAAYERVRPYGFFILLALIFTNVLDIIYRPIQILIRWLLF